MNILLIAGHGAGDVGATAKIDNVQYREADLTRDLVTRIKSNLSKYANVYIYDTTRNAYKDYQGGLLKSTANFSKYNYVLEVHFNACVQDYAGNGKTTGTEIYYPSKGSLSGAEYLICKKIGDTGLRNRGMKSGGFAVINTASSSCKANLLEVCFIDDADDMRLYLKNKDAVAGAIAAGIAESFKLSASTPATTQTTTSASVTISLPSVKEGSRGNTVKALQIILNGKGFDCGTADGIFGTKTLAALKNYQKSKGITATGVADAQTYKSLLS